MVLSWLFGSEGAARGDGFNLPDGPFRFLALDVETANGNPASICQIGIACVGHDGAMSVHSALVNPKQRFAPFNVQLHGIDEAAVKGAPDFPEAFAEIAPLLSRHLIFQHSGFDRRAMYLSCADHGLAEPEWRWADSVQVARRAWPEFKGNGGHGLAHLKRALDLEFEHHDAGEDAKAAAMVVLHAERKTGATLEALIAPAPRKSKAKAVVPLAEADLEALAGVTAALAESDVQGVVPCPADDAVSEADENDLAAQVGVLRAAVEAYFETGEVPTAHPALRIAVILAKHRETERERAFLAAWGRHFSHAGGRYGALVRRARKKGAVG